MNEAFVVTLAIILVGVPVVLGISLEMYKRHIAYKERRLELMADKTAERAAQYASQVERLEQRMRVLERIATDKGVHLAAEIEDLRLVGHADDHAKKDLN